MPTRMRYDIIGDIHGQAGKLELLLKRLGYADTAGTWRHRERTAVFVGDFVDRGPAQLATIRLVRKMIDAGAAFGVMGNHEFNAIAFHTTDGEGGYCRPHTDKNRRQHGAFLDEVAHDRTLHAELIDWFLSLPLWLELPGFRVVHACWHEPSMRALAPQLAPGERLTRDLVREASREGTVACEAVETLLKGVEVPLPGAHSFQDKDGHRRSSVRVRWWAAGLDRFDQAAMPVPGDVEIPAVQLPPQVLCGYDGTKPLFLGHYWLTGEPTLLSPHIACVDYSAGAGGPLVAYSWDGETTLDAANFMVAA